MSAVLAGSHMRGWTRINQNLATCNAAALAEATCSCIEHVYARTSNLAVDAGIVHRASLSGCPNVAADNLPENARR